MKKLILLFFPLFSLTIGCSLLRFSSAPQEPVRLVTKKGTPTQVSADLPIYIPIWVEEHQGEKLLSSRLGFKGWDMDHNGTIDMLEVLDSKGQVSKTLYDFDFDGKVDDSEL